MCHRAISTGPKAGGGGEGRRDISDPLAEGRWSCNSQLHLSGGEVVGGELLLQGYRLPGNSYHNN